MKCRHYASFPMALEGTDLNKENWDRLRVDNDSEAYSIPISKEEFERECKDSSELYHTVANFLQIYFASKNIKKVASMGAGKGSLEFILKDNNSELYLCCTDYAERSIERLKNVFLSCDEFKVFDILHDDFNILNKYDCIYFFRVSTEFDIKAWEQIFDRLYASEINKVIFIPTGIDNLKSMSKEKIVHSIKKLVGKKDYFCGWLYSDREFKKVFGKWMIETEKRIGKTKVYVLGRD